jgi:hypothetical protein
VPLGSVIQSLVSNLWFDNVVCSFSYVINKINPLYGCNKNITVFSKKKKKSLFGGKWKQDACLELRTAHVFRQLS